MNSTTTEPRFDVSYDMITDLEIRARRDRDRYMAACLRAGFHRLRGSVASILEGLTTRMGGSPRQV